MKTMSIGLMFFRGAAALAVGIAMSFGADLVAAENWSRFRGPNGAGVAADVELPATWTADDYAWKVKLPGAGSSSPIGWDDLLFVTAGDPQTGDITVLAVDAATGEINWTHLLESTTRHLHAANSYASSTPAADARHVYVSWGTSDALFVAALTHQGEVAWERKIGPLDYQHGFGGSLAIADGLLIVANDNASESFVAALDAESGEPRWRRDRTAGTESYATPVMWRAADGSSQVVVNSTEEGMAGLSLEDGSVQWQMDDVFPVRCVGSPVVAGGVIIGTSGEGGNGKSCTAVRPPASPGAKPEIAYELNKSLPQVPTPVATDDLLFVWSDRGVVSCYDLSSGKSHWTERVGGNYFGSPIIVGDKLLCIAADGVVTALAADKQYKLLGRSELGEPSSATPIVHRGHLILRCESSLASLPAVGKQ